MSTDGPWDSVIKFNLQCASVLRMLREPLHALTKFSEVGSNLTVNSVCGN